MKEIANQNIAEFYKDLELPVVVEVSFEKIFEHIKSLTKSKNPAKQMISKLALEQLDKKGELKYSFTDLSYLETYKDEIELLMKPLFPDMLQENEIKAGTLPFKPIFFNRTERFQKILDNAGEDFVLMPINLDHNIMYQAACLFVLNAIFEANINFSASFNYEIPNIKTGTMHYYRAFYNGDYLIPERNENSPDLSPEQIQELLDNYYDIDLWKKVIPPNSFTIKGFGLVTLLDVTSDMALSKLKDILVEENAMTGNDQLIEIQKDINSILRSSNLKIGITVFDSESLEFKKNGQHWNSFILQSRTHCSADQVFCDQFKSDVIKDKKPFVVSNLKFNEDSSSILIKSLINQGVRSFIAFPLVSEGKVIGVLELASEKINEFNLISVEALKEIIPIFTIALQRSQNQHETQLEAIIQAEFTSLHSTVEWRFFEEAQKIYLSNQRKEEYKIEDITFKDVYPLFGQSDIRNSTKERNKGIQSDMIAQLKLAEEVLKKVIKTKPLPFLDQLDFEIKSHIKHLTKGMGTGDEVRLLEFLNHEVDPVFESLSKENDLFSELINSYRKELDPKLGVVFRMRKAYEDSVTMINKILSRQLEKSQVSAQAMFPHYIESYKTDGIEHNIYIGQSLVKNKVFNEMYLHNLRLWQLITMCDIENLVYKKRTKLPIPLEIASLVLALSTPLSIKFRQDEKKFDVDGAYNVRYEIIKKRIDKAKIKGKNERITQPGKLAIVYTHDQEAAEYENYLKYLASLNYIEEKIEYLDLEILQETAGLKALRVKIIYSDNKKKSKDAMQLVKKLT